MRVVTPVLAAALLVPLGASAQTIVSRQESTPFPGVRVIEGRTANPATDFAAAVVSLCADHVHLTATRPATALSTTGRWATTRGVQVAANGDFFTTGPRVYGNAIGDGRAWPLTQTGNDPAMASAWYYRRYGWIGFGPDLVEFSHTEWAKERATSLGLREGWMPDTVTASLPRGITQLVSGFPELITEGRTYTCTSPTATSCFPDRSDMRARNPRTAMGLSRDRRTFFLVAVEGRSTRSAGMYGTELARLMELLGAWQAFNLDGGGSTTLWQRGRGSLVSPSDGTERAVANHWGIFAGAASGQPRRPGSCPAAPIDGGLRDGSVADVSRDLGGDLGRDVPFDTPRDLPLSDLPREVGPDVDGRRDVREDDAPTVLDVARDALADRLAPVDRDLTDVVSAPDLAVSEDDVVPDDDAGTPPDFIDAAREEMPAEDELITPPETEGCACRTGASSSPRPPVGLFLALGLARVARRRRARR